MFPTLVTLSFSAAVPTVDASSGEPLPGSSGFSTGASCVDSYQPPEIEWLPSFLHRTFFEVALWQYAALLLVILLGLVLRRLVFLVMTHQMRQFAARFGVDWVHRFSKALASPIALLSLSGLLALASPALQLPPQAAEFINLVIHLLIVLPCVWVLYRLAMLFCDRLECQQRDEKRDDRLGKDVLPIIRGMLQIVIGLVGLLFILQNVGVDVRSLLAGLGIGGIAIALAAKDTISNFFGSLVLVNDRPFKVGDKIVVNGVEGDVETIGFRSTRVRTYYDSLVTIPNSRLADSVIDSYGGRRYRRTSTSIGVSYDTTPEQLEAFVEGIRAILRANDFTRKDSYEVHFTGFGSHALEIILYFFIRNISWSVELREKQNIYLEIMRLAKALNVRFALPTQRLHHEFVASPGAPRVQPEIFECNQMRDIVNSFAPGGSASQPRTPTIAGSWTADFIDPRQEASVQKAG